LANYEVVFSIPPNTAKDSPYEEKVEIEGIVWTKLHVLIPDSHRGRVGFSIWYGDERIVPKGPNEWIEGNRAFFTLDVNWKLPEEVTKLVLKGYNLWDTYNHAFYLTLDVEDRISYSLLKELLETFKKFLALFGGG